MAIRGYVYILTNPSFRDDWIKIGKCTDDPIKRAKQLDTTAIPLPFHVFASIQTEKYEKLEKHLHKIFGKFANKRIRDGREFFNITPETALEEFKEQSEMLDDAQVFGPDYYAQHMNAKIPTKKEGKIQTNNSQIPLIGTTAVKEQNLYHHKRQEIQAFLEVKNDKFYLKKGSRIRDNITSNVSTIQNLREKYSSKVKNGEVIEDIEFEKPSAPSTFVCGTSSNGWNDWIDKDGNTLDQNIRAK